MICLLRVDAGLMQLHLVQFVAGNGITGNFRQCLLDKDDPLITQVSLYFVFEILTFI